MPEQCHYELHPKSAKEDMVRKIQQLQLEADTLEKAVGGAREKNNWLEIIISSLKNGAHYNELIMRIKRNDSYQSIALWLSPSVLGNIRSPLRASMNAGTGGEEQPATRDLLSVGKEGRIPLRTTSATSHKPIQAPSAPSGGGRARMDIDSMINTDD